MDSQHKGPILQSFDGFIAVSLDKLTNPLVGGCNGMLLSGVPDYFDRNKISSGGDLSHYSSASLY